MKKIFFLFILICSIKFSWAQTEKYFQLIKKADSLYYKKDYKNAGLAYSEAFSANNFKDVLEDRYNASCA